MVTESKDFVD